MILKLRAKHFKDTKFMCDECAIGKAFKEQFDLKEFPSTGEHFVRTKEREKEKVWYKFKYYSKRMFNNDRKKAENLRYNQIVREIKLIKND